VTAAATGIALNLTRWRDNDPDVLDEPGVALGTVPAAGDPVALAAEWWAAGVRRVALDRPVDLTGGTGGTDAPTAVWAMVLLRELSGRGMTVDWSLVLPDPDLCARFNHLYPPAGLTGFADAGPALTEWRESYFVDKFCYRHGPGFIEVRDHRAGEFSRFVIDGPEFLPVVDALLGGVPSAEVDAEVLADLTEEGLAAVAGDLAWWLPYRITRWPWPALVV
jgi:hypothetical protein